MLLSTILSIVLALSVIVLGVLVLNKNKTKPTNFLFFIITVCAATWIITNAFVDRARDYSEALFWGRLTILGPMLIPSVFLLFSKYFPENKRQRFDWWLYILPVILPLPLLLTEYNISSVSFRDGAVQVIPGTLYLYLGAYLLAYFILGSVILLKKYKENIGIKKLQIRYVFLGIILTAFFASVTNLFLPLLGVNQLQNLGSISTIFLVYFVSYSIVRHRLLDIRFVLTRSLVYGVLLSITALLFVFVTFISGQFFDDTTSSKTIIAVFVAALIVYGLDPLKAGLSSVTDRFFYKAKVDYQTVLRNLSETLNYELDLTKLIVELRETLRQQLKIKSAATLLRKATDSGITEKFEALPELLQDNPNLSLRNDSPLIQYLREHRHVAIYESLERKIEDSPESERGILLASKEEFERLGAALAMPIFAQGHLVAVLTLGQKLSGDSFSNDDLQLIDVLSPQIGSAIQKANLFEEVKEFSAGLKQRVEEATQELRERNTSLQILQKLTREITHTLDFNKVVQQIADSVAAELGYMGAILVFLDDDGQTVRARAVTQTSLTAKALRLLPGLFSDLTTRLDDSNSTNVGHQVLKTGQTMITSSLPQVISPPVPKLLAFEIQKLMHVKSVVVVPIFSEGKIIGCIEVGVQKPQEEISKHELDTMQSLADELGVVARNLSLFSAIQRTNRQLEEANRHLQQLDQAKSEFVSIASHQLRTPMTGIMGYLSMMTQGDFGKLAPEHADILRNLLSESQRMIRLINQFLNVSKIEAGKFTYTKKPVKLADMVQHQVTELQKVAKDKGVKLSFTPPKGTFPTILADGDKLEDVVLNLIDNAIKYTAKGTISVSVEATNNEVHFSVKDSGIGIKASDASELFNKFVRGSGIAQIHPDGSGLGLFIAKSIIDAHGGRIWAESAGEGQGSTFRFSIPIVAPSASDLALANDNKI